MFGFRVSQAWSPGVGDRSCWIPCIYLQLYIKKQNSARVKPETCTANKENTTHGHCHGHGHGHCHCATASRRVSPHHDTALGPARSVRTRLHTAAVLCRGTVRRTAARVPHCDHDHLPVTVLSVVSEGLAVRAADHAARPSPRWTLVLVRPQWSVFAVRCTVLYMAGYGGSATASTSRHWPLASCITSRPLADTPHLSV